MKKALSLVLAIAMMLSMASVAFAATSVVTDYDFNSSDSGVADVKGPYQYDGDEKELKDLANGARQYGKTVYFLLINNAGEIISDSDAVRNLKIKADWDMGDLVDGVAVVKKKVTSGGALSDATWTGDYAYMIEIKIKNSTSTSDSDIIGTLTLNNSKRDFKVKDMDLDISFGVNWDKSYISSDAFVLNDLNTIDDLMNSLNSFELEKYYSLNFKAAYEEEEETMEFGNDDWTFTSDFRGQGKLLVYADNKFNSAIADQYPTANLDFYNGNGAKFNKTGEMFIAADEGSFIYQINDNGTLSAVRGADYDDYDEGFYFYTRTLGKYVVSDEELDLSASAPVIDVTPGDVVTPANPSTGAAA